MLELLLTASGLGKGWVDLNPQYRHGGIQLGRAASLTGGVIVKPLFQIKRTTDIDGTRSQSQEVDNRGAPRQARGHSPRDKHQCAGLHWVCRPQAMSKLERSGSASYRAPSGATSAMAARTGCEREVNETNSRFPSGSQIFWVKSCGKIRLSATDKGRETGPIRCICYLERRPFANATPRGKLRGFYARLAQRRGRWPGRAAS